MSRFTWSGSLAAIVFVVVSAVGAQSPPTAQNPRSPTAPPAAQEPATGAPAPSQGPAAGGPSPSQETAPPNSQASDGRVIVTGCLREASAAPGGARESASSAADAAGKADAANGEPKFVLADAVPASSNTAATDAHATAPRTYVLVANDAALNPHVGKKLELTGMIDNSSAAASAPRLLVQSGKVLTGGCAP